MEYDDPDYDDEAWEESSDRCPDCGAYPEEYHEMDCGYSDDDEDIDAEVMDCSSHLPSRLFRVCEVEELSDDDDETTV
jgi:hypothetical protein